MAPSAVKANYKSYEAQARLVRAIVAAHPTTKWNYKEIAACYGSDMTEHALNHRFRYIRAHSEVIIEGRKANLDVKNLTTDESSLPKTVGGVDKNNIAKYFGQSTADGIQFQFRAIKQDANKMRATADGGGDPSTCLDLGAGSNAPSFTPNTTPKTPRSHNFATPTTGGGTTGAPSTKRGRAPTTVVKIESDDDDDDSESTHNWSEMEATPSKRPRKLAGAGAAAAPGQKNGTPSRLAAARASATIADTSARLQTSESEAEAPQSSFGIKSEFPTHTRNGMSNGARPSSAFAIASVSARPLMQPQQPQQRAAPSLFGSVPTFEQPAPESQPSPSPSPSLFAGSDAFRKTGRDAFVGSNGDDVGFDTPAADSAYWDDDDPVEGEI
ncbi:hypothetical protein LEL_04396 [Akanthomyces lecanii RCEF 1005]|uniref:Uncharacterized protein n=1 Tax=Akanthomyces lecanii RCEF 1005 TaxID=1081108 RepID=A0A162K6E6_CORDF|nr:hypothetical protein LEL_04396 [Akanthomyces lecanii RCEF 1005]